MNQSINVDTLNTFHEEFRSSVVNIAAMNTVTANGLAASARNPEAIRTTRHSFSISLEQGDVTNQKRSGRCWMFAALNTFRFQIMKKLNLKTFELSQNYTLFYDKLEKANYFYENILETLEEPTDGRLISWLLSAPLGDGGQWDMLANLIRKYGVVPKEAMPETKCSSATNDLCNVLTRKLRADACKLRKAYAAGSSLEELRKEKEAMMATVYRVLAIALGEPPKTFDFEVTDKDNNFHRDLNITPLQFFEKYVGLNLDDYVSLINAPTADKPYHHAYTVRFLGNVKEGSIVRYLNLPSEDLKNAAIKQLESGEPVWFGCDVGKSSAGDEDGIMDMTLYNYEALLGIQDTFSKADRLDYGESLMTHAMVLQGVNLDDNGKPNRWRVENSWGKDSCHDGYYVMNDGWFDEYVYQIVVNKKFLPEEFRKEYDTEPILLQPWDPMGSLAD